MTKLTRRKFIKRGILASIGLVLLDTLWFEKYVIDWNYFDISKSEKNKIKIIQISDLHFDKLRYFHKSIAKKINLLIPVTSGARAKVINLANLFFYIYIPYVVIIDMHVDMKL